MKSVAILLMAVSTRLSAQWLDYPDSRTPRTKDGKPNFVGTGTARKRQTKFIRCLAG